MCQAYMYHEDQLMWSLYTSATRIMKCVDVLVEVIQLTSD